MNKLSTCLLILGATVCLAQPPGHGPGNGMGNGPGNAPGNGSAPVFRPGLAELKAYLGLTDAQISSLQAIQRGSTESMKTVVEQIQEKRKALQTLITQGTDPAAAGKLLFEIAALQKQLEDERDDRHDQAIAVLTADQKLKLKTLEEAAKLRFVIQQAMQLNLLEPLPMAGPGPGQGPQGPMHGMAPFSRRPDQF